MREERNRFKVINTVIEYKTEDEKERAKEKIATQIYNVLSNNEIYRGEESIYIGMDRIN